jgi:ATP-dependent exoDNAse (exonuclease V) alpha subunit
MVLSLGDIVISLPKLGIDFDLSSQQVECLEEMYQFILPPGYSTFTLMGFAGTGKTTIVKIFLEILKKANFRDHQIVLTAPTHRAKNVLEELSGKEAFTIHSVLSLSPNIDIEKLDMDNLEFDPKSEPTVPYKGVLIVDESSMVNDTLFELITDFSQQNLCKVIFLGDPDQLKPVKQNTISKAFTEGYGFSLTQIHRQEGENPLGPIIADVRENIRSTASYPFITNLNENGEGIEFVNFNSFLEKIFSSFTSTDFSKDNTKILCFTNERVRYLNSLVREVRDFNDVINVGDVLLLYDNLDVGRKNPLSNSTDYTVVSVKRSDKDIYETFLSGYEIMIQDEKEMIYSFFLLDPDSSPVYQQTASYF